MKVNFLRISEIELKEAVDYLNEQSEGLGYEFANEVRRTIKRVIDFPDAWTSISVNTRRARTNRFPYGVLYSHTDDELLILGIMHLHRDPEHWKDRI